jgi:hypothetical protein
VTFELRDHAIDLGKLSEMGEPFIDAIDERLRSINRFLRQEV